MDEPPQPTGSSRSVTGNGDLASHYARDKFHNSQTWPLKHLRREGQPDEPGVGRKTEGQRRPDTRDRNLARVKMGTLGESFDVEERVSTAHAQDEAFSRVQEQVLTDETFTNPPAWDSTLCMTHWGMPELQREMDPNGYLIYVSGREQLGGNKNLVADGIFLAKSLGRTFVEYPVKNAMVVPYEEASIGLGAYWDLTELCMYHRILDLRAFSRFIVDGIIPPEAFMTIRSDSDEVYLSRVKTEADAVELFRQYAETKVIVMQRAWKSNVHREALQYLRPNRFYMGVVRMLLRAQEGWGNGEFLAVQWRTELSEGDLAECYEEVKAVVEEHRTALGYGVHQVLFNVDFSGKTSATYTASAQEAGHAVLTKIQEDYPQALNNRVHQFLARVEDAGVRAFLSGLTVASSAVMIGSSLNDPATKSIAAARRCQKPFSGFITLITEWREQIMYKPRGSVVRMFPFDAPA